jgi:hypothetical protein
MERATPYQSGVQVSSLAVTVEARPRTNSVALIPSIMAPCVAVSSKKTASSARCGIFSYYIPKVFREFLLEGLFAHSWAGKFVYYKTCLASGIFEAQLGV